MNSQSNVVKAHSNEASVSFLRKGSAGCVDSHCHAIRYRFSNSCSLDQLKCNYGALVRELSARGQSEEIADAVLWVEAIGSNAGASIAEQRRQAELRRPVTGPPDAAWRALVLEYQGGT